MAALPSRHTREVSGNEIAILLGNRGHVAQEIGKEWTYLLYMDGYVASAFIEGISFDLFQVAKRAKINR